MSNNGRKNWKAEATELKARNTELEAAAEGWKSLASSWRQRYIDLNDQVIETEARIGVAQRAAAEEATADEPVLEPDG